MIKVMKSMVVTSSNVEEALNKALRQTSEQRSQQQAFADAVESFQRHLLQDLEKSSKETESYFTRIVKKVDSAVQKVLGNLSSTVKIIETEVGDLSEVSLGMRNHSMIEAYCLI